MNRIKINSTLKDTIINHFEEDLKLYAEQDIYELNKKLIYCAKYNKK